MHTQLLNGLGLILGLSIPLYKLCIRAVKALAKLHRLSETGLLVAVISTKISYPGCFGL